MRYFAMLAVTTIAVSGCVSLPTESDVTREAPKTEKLLVSNVPWEQLNPARGDKSPQAGTLWGNRKGRNPPDQETSADCPICCLGEQQGAVPTGFLARFVDGFSSPPHIHNVTYRAVVISGLVHNDDPDAAPMWMPAGSFWTQPKGEVHITSAKGDDVVALVEIDHGPYLVLPPEKAFDSGERPVNVDVNNLVWVDPQGHPPSDDGPKVAYLWGSLRDGESNGTFLRLPPGFSGTLHSHGSTFRAVVIKGQLDVEGSEPGTYDPGSYFGACGDVAHRLSCPSDEACTIYIRTNAKYEISSGKT